MGLHCQMAQVQLGLLLAEIFDEKIHKGLQSVWPSHNFDTEVHDLQGRRNIQMPPEITI
jgi:hypothetical protein